MDVCVDRDGFDGFSRGHSLRHTTGWILGFVVLIEPYR
jgi:hypothetical protein